MFWPLFVLLSTTVLIGVLGGLFSYYSEKHWKQEMSRMNKKQPAYRPDGYRGVSMNDYHYIKNHLKKA
jgi:hypothetical protein